MTVKFFLKEQRKEFERQLDLEYSLCFSETPKYSRSVNKNTLSIDPFGSPTCSLVVQGVSEIPKHFPLILLNIIQNTHTHTHAEILTLSVDTLSEIISVFIDPFFINF